MQVEMAHLAMVESPERIIGLSGSRRPSSPDRVFPGDQITVRLAANDREDYLQVRAQLSVGEKKVGSVILDLQAS